MEKQTNRLAVTVALFIATFMSGVEGTIVSTAMPTIVASLDGLAIMNWVFAIYLLSSAVMTPIYGKLADKYGRKRIFMVGITLFVLGSALCAAAQSMHFLVMARLIQGIGAGSILPISMTIIADLYPVEQRANIMGLNNAAWGIASIVAPLIGGILVEKLSWHWIFLFNVPIGIVVIILVGLFLFEKKSVLASTPLDLKGTSLLVLFLLTFLYMFQMISDQNGVTLNSLGLLGLSIVILALFIYVESKAIDPVLPLRLFRKSTFVIVNVVTFLVSGFLIGLEAYTPMWLQLLNGVNASISGMALASMSIFWMVGSFFVGKLMVRFNVRRVLMIGVACLLVSACIFSCFVLHTPYIAFVLTGCLLGIGFGISMTTTTIAAQESAPKEMIGVATSTNTLFRMIGQSMMVSVYGLVLNMNMNRAMQHYEKVDHGLMNQFMNVQTTKEMAAELIRPLREIAYAGLHHIYMTGLWVIIVAFILVVIVSLKRTSKS